MQREFFGRGSSANILQTLQAMGANKLLLVTGRASYENCGARAAFEELLSAYEVALFRDFSANPQFNEAVAGSGFCAQSGADVVIAIGGGSAIDIAKCIVAFRSAAGKELELATGLQPVPADTLPLIAVPTTAGTGSEATHFAVIYVDGKKYSLASPALLPHTAILDPVYTDLLPPYITASTGFDALCQAVESYWSSGATQESQGYAEAAIKLLTRHLPLVVNRPDEEARDAVFRAANLAGKAINISKTTAPHALSYTITSLYGVPHGHAVAMTLGAFFPFHDLEQGAVLSGGLSREGFLASSCRLLELFGVDTFQAAKDYWYGLMSQCGLNVCVGDTEIAESDDLEDIVSNVNLERLSNHPVKLDGARLLEILRSIPSI